MTIDNRQSIIKEIGLWFGDLSNEFKEDATFGYVIRGMIARLKQGEIPPRKMAKVATSPLSQDLKKVFGELDKLRGGYRPPKRTAEASAILRMLNKGFTPEQITEAWKVMKKDKFWLEKELFMMSVESQIGAIVNKSKTERDTNKYFSGDYGHMVRR